MRGRTRGARRGGEADMNEKAAAVEIAFLELSLSREGPEREWFRGLLERFKKFAETGKLEE